MRTAVIVQARLSSTRLPGKVLESIGRRSVLEEVLLRCQAIQRVDTVCCATVEGPEGDDIQRIAEAIGVEVVRGPLEDVLGRYARAATLLEADVIMRVTSDCPLIDPSVCEAVLSLREQETADYASNNLKREWPHGLDCEAVRTERLLAADSESRSPFDREHVTPWIRNHPEVQRVHLTGPGGAAARERWTVDYPEDLAMIRALMPLIPEGPLGWDYRRVISVLDDHPSIRALNSMRADHSRP